MKTMFLLSALFAVASVLASPISQSDNASPLPHKTLFQFNETGTFLENIVVRSNGDLVITMFYPTANIYTFREPYSAQPRMELIHTFEDAGALVGIAETSPDTFIIAACNFTTWPESAPGSVTLKEVKLDVDGQLASSRTAAHIPDAGLLNGIVTIPGLQSPAVLVADVRDGVVYRVEVTTGAYEIVLDVPETKATGGEAIQNNLGVNGVKIRKGYLYWSNTSKVAIFRIRIDERGYPVPGAPAEKVGTVENAISVDDFTIDAQGTIWVMTGFDNMLVTMEQDGTNTVVLGSPSELTIGGDTAGAFGNTALDSDVLYITTDGSMALPVNGTTETGKVVAVNTRGAPNPIKN